MISYREVFEFADLNKDGCLSETEAVPLFDSEQEGAVEKFFDNALKYCPAPTKKELGDNFEVVDACLKWKFGSPTTCSVRCTTKNLFTGKQEVLKVQCEQSGLGYHYQLPDIAQCEGLYCHGPTGMEQQYFSNTILPRIEDPKVARSTMSKLKKANMDQMMRYTAPMAPTGSRILTGMTYEEILYLQGGVKTTATVQEFVARNEDGVYTTKTGPGSGEDRKYFNSYGMCPSVVVKVDETTPPEMREVALKQRRVIAANLPSGESIELILPRCAFECSGKHNPTLVKENLFDTKLFSTNPDMLRRFVRCEFNPTSAQFEYPMPLLPRCITGSCWGYPGAVISTPNGDVEYEKLKHDFEPDRVYSPHSDPPEYYWGVKGVDQWTNPSVDIYSNDIWLERKEFAECPPERVSPSPVPRYNRPMRENYQPLPRPVPHPVSAEIGSLGDSTSRRKDQYRQLMFAAWPTDKLQWGKLRSVTTISFPSLAHECDALNANSTLKETMKVTFAPNPSFDPTKEAYEPGGRCHSDTQGEQTTRRVISTATTPASSKGSRQVIEEQALIEPRRETPPLRAPPVPPHNPHSSRVDHCVGEPIGSVFYDGAEAFGIAGGSLQVQVGPPVSSLNSMTAADALKHLRFGTSPQSLWIDALRGGFGCSEEASSGVGIFTPGGDLAELIVAIASWSKSDIKRSKIQSDEEPENGIFLELDSSGVAVADVYGVLIRWLVEGDVQEFGFCVNRRQLDFLCRETQWCPQDVRALLQPPAQVMSTLLDLVDNPEFSGSRHLRAMLVHPTRYDVDERVIKTSLKAIYSLLWDVPVDRAMSDTAIALARSKLHIHFSDSAAPRASGLIDVSGGDCPSGLYPALSPLSVGGTQVIVRHSDAAKLFRFKLAAFLGAYMRLDVSAGDLIEIRDQMSSRADEAWKTTQDIFSLDLPVFCTRYSPPDTQECIFRSPFPGSAWNPLQPFMGSGEVTVMEDPLSPPGKDLDPESLSAGEIREALEMEKIEWISTYHVHLGTVDSRQSEPVVNILGGDMGQWIIALAMYEKSLGHSIAIDQALVDKLFVNYLKHGIRQAFAMHIDTSGLGSMCHAGGFCAPLLEADNARKSIEDTLSRLIRLPATEAAVVMPAAVQAQSQGDLFLQMLLRDEGNSLGVTADLASAAIKSFYGVLWNTLAYRRLEPEEHVKLASQLDLVVLQGVTDRHRAALTVYHTPEAPVSQSPRINPSTKLGQILIYDHDASRLLRNHFLEAILPEALESQRDFGGARIAGDLLVHNLAEQFLYDTSGHLPKYVVIIH